MSARSSHGRRRGASGVEVRHRWGLVAFGLLALVIVSVVLFPHLRPRHGDELAPRTVDGATRMLVLAASSLTAALSEAAEAYEAAHPEWKLDLSFAASNTLRRQIENGAPADLFLSASAAPVQALVEGSWVMRDRDFVMWTTELVLIAPADGTSSDEAADGEDETDPADEDGEVDPTAALLASRRIAVGDVGVPVGEYAREALSALGVLEKLRERMVPLPNETAVVQAVATGACDLGIAYASSTVGIGREERVRVIATLPSSGHEPIVYHGAIPARSPHDEAVMAFLRYLSEGEGATILEHAGFHAPVAPVH